MNILSKLGIDRYFSDATVILSIASNTEPSMENKTISVPLKDFSRNENNINNVFVATRNEISLKLYGTVLDEGTKIQLTASSPRKLNIKSIAISFDYKSNKDISLARIPTGYDNVFSSGMKLLGQERRTGPDSMMCALFYSYSEPCLFLGTLIPQKNIHSYYVELIDRFNATIRAETVFTYGQSLQKSLSTESFWISGDKNPVDSIMAWSENFDKIPDSKKSIITGWNSWDYYFSTVSHDDIMENVNAIKEDAVLSESIKYITIDDGWQHMLGEWMHNYKFPNGMKYTADEIKKNGFIPGIWTSPLLVDGASNLALRHSDLLVKNEYGDPQSVDGTFILDPTHPSSAEYLYNLYRGLYDDGFRLFKVDWVSTIKKAYTFHKQDAGPYEALRELFTIIRSAVAEESYILGCSYPAEAGGGFVDSRRIGVDIHNYWSHVEWITERLQLTFWEGDRIATTDPDFMLARAGETSLEKETNVANFNYNRQKALGAEGGRWRAGDIWTFDEMQTWLNLASFTGGNRFLSDRITMLNQKGKDALYKALNSPVANAIPLDLGEKSLSEFWLQEVDGKQRLLIVNFSENAREMKFDAKKYGLASEVKISVMLDKHASIIVEI